MPKGVQDILALVGNTPLVPLRRLVQPSWARVLVKLESCNPSGSVKDRIVLAILEAAEQQGLIEPGATLVEASAGNTAIAVAVLGAAKGYRVVIAMPESVPLERRRLLGRLGAQIHLTDSRQGMAGAQKAASALAQEHGYYQLNQFENPVNPQAHRSTTAPEVLEATAGVVDAFVAGVGTGGTITGVGEALKQESSTTLVVAVEPARSPLLSKGWSAEHGIAGIGTDFVPPLLNRSIIDEIIPVSDDEALNMMNALAKEEGLIVGVSSGANVVAAKSIAQRLGPGKTVVTIMADSGERYLAFPT